MPRETSTLIETAQTAFESQSRELESTRERQLRAVVTQTASGSGNISEWFKLDRKFRLVFLRGHFTAGTGTASLHIELDSAAGASFDTRLFTVSQAGTGKDVNLRIDDESALGPSPWTFQAGDSIRVVWTNPDSGTMNWGLEIGLTLAS